MLYLIITLMLLTLLANGVCAIYYEYIAERTGLDVRDVEFYNVVATVFMPVIYSAGIVAVIF